MHSKFSDAGRGKPIIMFYAFPLNRKMWRLQAESLLTENYRVILPDLDGFGANLNFPPLFDIEAAAREIAALLAALEIERAVVCGLSMGGYVALNLYRLFPEKFAGLILCDTTASADTAEKRASRFVLIEKIQAEGSSVLVEKLLPGLTADETAARHPELLADLEKTILGLNPAAAVAALRGMAVRPDQTHLLSSISCPTALIFGEHDKITKLENAVFMHHRIPGSVLYRIRDAGHLSNLEQPVQFNRALIDFCARAEF